MDDSEFFKLWRDYKLAKDRLDQLPRLIDKLMFDELELRRSAYLDNSEESKRKIEEIRWKRERLQTEMLERRASLPVLKKKTIESARNAWNDKIKAEEARLVKLSENIEASKSRIDQLLVEFIGIAVELWGTDFVKKNAISYITSEIEDYLNRNPDLPEAGIENELIERTRRYEKERDSLYQLWRISVSDEDIDRIKNIISPENDEKSKEEKIRLWVTALTNAKDPGNVRIK